MQEYNDEPDFDLQDYVNLVGEGDDCVFEIKHVFDAPITWEELDDLIIKYSTGKERLITEDLKNLTFGILSIVSHQKISINADEMHKKIVAMHDEMVMDRAIEKGTVDYQVEPNGGLYYFMIKAT